MSDVVVAHVSVHSVQDDLEVRCSTCDDEPVLMFYKELDIVRLVTNVDCHPSFKAGEWVS